MYKPVSLGVLLALSVAGANADESGTVKSWEYPTGIGVAVREATPAEGVTLNAWCLASTGATGNVSEKLAKYLPGMPEWGLKLVRNTFARKGDVVCVGRAGPRNTDHKQKLSFSVAWWEQGTMRDSDTHPCIVTRHQCAHRWGSKRGAHQTSEATDALSVCIDVTANKGRGPTLQSLTMSHGEGLPAQISEANGKFSENSCAEREAEWKS